MNLRRVSLALLVCWLMTSGDVSATRTRQPLECFPLSTLRYVDREWRHALVRSPDGRLHRVQPGSYLGRDDGRLMKVTRAAILLTELHPDGEGGWYEVDVQLPRSPRNAIGPVGTINLCLPPELESRDR